MSEDYLLKRAKRAIERADRLDESERLLNKYSCPCGSGGGIACDDWCPGDTTSEHLRDAVRLMLAEIREMFDESDA